MHDSDETDEGRRLEAEAEAQRLERDDDAQLSLDSEGTEREGEGYGDADAGVGPEDYGDDTRLPSLRQLTGMPVRDRAGERIGNVTDVYLDSGGRYVRYLAVRGGLLSGRRRHLVPVDDVTHAVDEDGSPHVVIPYMKDQLLAGPDVSPDDEVTPDTESAVYAYYQRIGYWDRAREILAARQTTPAPTPEIAEAEMTDAISRGRAPEDVGATRVRRWGA